MRKQYHSKKIKDTLFIWDVHNLIAKSKHLPVIKVKISNIKELDENYWFQGESDNPTCKTIADHLKLIEECDLQFPIILAADGSVMDGMHRVCKAYLNGQSSLKAVKFKNTPTADFENVRLEDLAY